MRTSRALVVEDEFLLAREMADALHAGGYEVAGVASSAEAALRLARSEPVDIAILDLDVRGHAIEEVFEILVDRGARLVFVTGHRRSELPAWLPPSLHFEKPVPASSIVAALRQISGDGRDDAGRQGRRRLPYRPPRPRSAVLRTSARALALCGTEPPPAFERKADRARAAAPPAIPAAPISVGIALRDALLREGLRRILAESGFAVSAEAKSPEAILARAAPPLDILLCDGADLCPRLLESAAGLRRGDRLPAFVFMLAGAPDDGLLQLGASLGASSYLAKDISPVRLKQALQRIAAGAAVVMPPAVDWRPEAPPVDSRRRPSPAAMSADLSHRERQVAAGLICGYSNKHIANRLKISEGTVKTHMKAILKKTRARNRTQGALWAIAHGITKDEFERPA